MKLPGRDKNLKAVQLEVLRHMESPVFDNFTLNFGASSFISVVFSK